MMNYFALLEIPASFLLDREALRQAYVVQQRRFHPDTMIHKTSTERLKAAQTAATLNEAYQTLQDDVKRGLHFLALRAVTPLPVLQDAAVLQENIMQREAVEEAKTAEELATLARQNNILQDSVLVEINDAFQQQEDAAAHRLLWRLHYIRKVATEITERQAFNVAATQ